MLKGINENGEMKNVKVTDNGEVLVKMNNESGETEGSTTKTEIVNTSENPVQVEVKNQVTMPSEMKVNNEEANPVPVKVTNQSTVPSEIKVNNTTDSAIPVSVQKETETTLNASVQAVGTTDTTIAINKKVTKIDIANYSESANVTLVAGDLSAVIGANIATTIVLNKEVTNISLTSTEADTKVQLIVSGVE